MPPFSGRSNSLKSIFIELVLLLLADVEKHSLDWLSFVKDY